MYLKLGITLIILFLCCSAICHVPIYISTPSDRIEQYCILAESCIHDTIPVCGQMADKKRSFLDICDMLEYVCDTMQIFLHIEDEDGCPIPRPRKRP